MSQILFAAVLIMPLALLPLQAHTQMVPVSPAETAQPFLGDSSARLYSTSEPIVDHAGPAVSFSEAAPEAAPSSSSTEALVPLTPTASSLSLADPLPAAAPSSAGDPLTASPGPGAPVTLPPKPAKVHDLPSPLQGDRPRIHPFRAAAFGLTAGTLGAGGELAVPIASTLNVRVGASYLLWRYPFNVDGIDYNPGVKFTSGRATIDWFPHHGAFHISAGALYFRNAIGGSAEVLEGQTFSLGGTNYINSVDDPIRGTASITYGKQIAPMLLLGFGNILPRSGRHLSMPFEFGGAYLKPPTLNLKLNGTACTTEGCFNAGTNTEVQANLLEEVKTLQSDMRFLQVYPLISLGLACRF